MRQTTGTRKSPGEKLVKGGGGRSDLLCQRSGKLVFLGTLSACTISGAIATRRLACADPADLF